MTTFVPPLVSVLIAARNAGRWLAATLESVLAQSWPALEVIVAEGGSDDDTRDVARRYRERCVQVVPGAPQPSAPANRNRAFAASTGAFIFYLDADDLIAPETIEALVTTLSGDPHAVAIGQWGRFYGQPEEARFGSAPGWDSLPGEEWLLREWSGGQPMMAVGTFLIPRPVAERAGQWDERLIHLADFEYFTRVLLTARTVKSAPGARLYYRSGLGGTLSSRRTPAAWESAWLSLDGGTRALLDRSPGTRSSRVVADLFQRLAFDSYLEHETIASRAQSRADACGGSSVEMGGGWWFRLMRDLFGWQAAKRVKRQFYRLGYGRLARWKETTFAGSQRV